MQVETKHKTVAACLLMAHTGGFLKTNVRKTLNSYHERKLLFCSSLAVGSLATDEDSLPGKYCSSYILPSSVAEPVHF